MVELSVLGGVWVEIGRKLCFCLFC
jgi:hypothetical protein